MTVAIMFNRDMAPENLAKKKLRCVCVNEVL